MNMELFMKIAQVFSPGAPIDSYDLFAGRTSQISDVSNAVNQRGQHVMIYGERGVGKTSLTRVLTELLAVASSSPTISRHVNCDVNDTFSSLFHKVFREIILSQQLNNIGFTDNPQIQRMSLDNYAPQEIKPEDVRMLLSQLGQRSIVTIDELDRIKDKNATVLLTDLIKTMSDNSTNATLVLVGVADDVDQLIEGHRSIERSLVQVHMPRMSVDELNEIISKATMKLKMTIDPVAKNKILGLSDGLPHYTHLLALNSFQNACSSERTHVIVSDVEFAIETAIKKAQQSIMRDYHMATTSTRRDVIYDKVLTACALAKTDELGYFAAADVREPLSLIAGKRYEIPAFARHLKDFCEDDRGPVLQKTGVSRRYRYRFINPMLQPYVLMQGLSKRYIDDSYLMLSN